MAASIREQILQALMGLLTPVASAQGATLARSPVIGVTREQSPALLLFPESDIIVERPNDRVERHLVVRLVALARGDDAFIATDELLVAAHGALMTDASLAGLALGLREIDAEWDAEDADAGVVALPARYQIRYRTLANDLTQPG